MPVGHGGWLTAWREGQPEDLLHRNEVDPQCNSAIGDTRDFPGALHEGGPQQFTGCDDQSVVAPLLISLDHRGRQPTGSLDLHALRLSPGADRVRLAGRSNV